MAEAPLEGIRVLDLTRLLPGPMCSLHLADMGADVIKIEDTGAGDYARASRGYYELINRNKRSVAIDLKQTRGLALFHELVGSADVLIEGFRPGVVERLGIDFASLRTLRPVLVYASITGYGQSGPYRERAGHDLNYCALAGITDQIGALGGAPVIPNLQIADLMGGALSAAMGVLAALVAARHSGQGRYLDVAMTDCALAHGVIPLMAVNDTGAAPPRGAGFLSGGLPWYRVYETSDGRYVALGALEKKFWAAFCRAIDKPEWVDVQNAEHRDRWDAVGGELSALFRTRSRAAWERYFEGVDCCLSPVLQLSEAETHPQLRSRAVIFQRHGKRQFAMPIKFSDHEFAVRRDAPGHGEHTREVLGELGVSAAECAELAQQGVIGH